MTNVIFHELTKQFDQQGRRIELIPSKSIILFNIHPFSESFLGWDKINLCHFTILDCIPLADLSEDEILSGNKKIKSIIGEAINAIRIEDDRMKALKMRALAITTEKKQMLWL